jgi:hypothetical protein
MDECSDCSECDAPNNGVKSEASVKYQWFWHFPLPARRLLIEAVTDGQLREPKSLASSEFASCLAAAVYARSMRAGPWLLANLLLPAS